MYLMEFVAYCLPILWILPSAFCGGVSPDTLPPSVLSPSLRQLRLQHSPSQLVIQQDGIGKQRVRSFKGILDNIGPNGLLAPNAYPGVIIASPSTVNPDYFYTWTRDAALVTKALVDELRNGSHDLQATIDAYVASQARLQAVTSLSGSLYTGASLGEPKFNVNETKFAGPWGRPQRDGPALRAVTLMSYAEWLLDQGDGAKASNVVWPVIANDLNYVAEYWNQTGFGPWEEVNASSFFALQAQARALTQGSLLASRLNTTCPNCDSQAPQVVCFLRSFWSGSTVIANLNTDVQRSDIDVSILLGALVAFDVDADCQSELLQPCSPKILASHKALVEAFLALYPINKDFEANEGVNIGRYPEDVYQGGNPWFLATFAAAEVLYAAAMQWQAQRYVIVDDTAFGFFRSVNADIIKGNHSDGAAGGQFATVISAVTRYADDFLLRGLEHAAASGDLSEQYDRTTGFELSAANLTWSYAAFLSASARRAGAAPPSWGARTLPVIPTTCSPSCAKGTYQAAVAAGAPARASLCTVPVEFRVLAPTYWSETVLLYGDSSELGAWAIEGGWPLGAQDYSEAAPLWNVRLELPAAETLAYRYVRRGSDGSLTPECRDRTLQLGQCGTGLVTVKDEWRS